MIVAAGPVSLKSIPVVSQDGRRIVCKQPHGHAGMGMTTHGVYCAACGRLAMKATQVIGAMTETTCGGTSCRAMVRYEVDEYAICVTTTRRT